MDRREIMLQRLLAVLQSIPGIKTCERNLDQVAASQRPAIIVIDAHEMVDRGSLLNLTKPTNAPTIVDMSPQIILSLSGTKGQDDVGTQLNNYRVQILAAVLKDPTMQSLLSPNGTITYEGCGTSIARGGKIEGEMGINLCFHYPLIPEELS